MHTNKVSLQAVLASCCCLQRLVSDVKIDQDGSFKAVNPLCECTMTQRNPTCRFPNTRVALHASRTQLRAYHIVQYNYSAPTSYKRLAINMPIISTSTEEAPQRLPRSTERNMNAQALLPSQRPLLDFFRTSLSSFQSSSNTPFQVICTLTPPKRSGPAALLQNRILVHPNPTPSPPRASPPRKLVVLDSSFNPPTLAHMRMATDAVLQELKRTQGPGAVRLLLLLAIQNADKAAKPAAFEHRLAMMWSFAKDVRRTLLEAITTESGDEEADVAIDVGLSTQPYFHDKSAAIAQSDFYKAHGEDFEVDTNSKEPEPEQVILAGYDTLVRIFNPKYYGEPAGDDVPIRRALGPFFQRARLRVTMRTDADWGNMDEQMAYVDDLLKGNGLEKIGGKKEWADRIEVVNSRKEGETVVSSTLAREAAKARDAERLGGLVPPEVKRWVEGGKLYLEDA